ncbi:hypothetical protein NHX12_024407 [Muraenolepis orangiensis]|uniref:Uncharacterized protein n=1 Tax=Muraenolepis orangiensis TaxID=630683 RepID=A0A9Q0EI52_9TELE|nr:hypothetical protein NHX12_024407 [Muraenolepis orangiensis]
MRWKPYVCVLLGDTLLWLLLYCELLLLQCSSCGGLPGLWAFGLFKWTFMLLAWTVFNGDKPPGPVLHRFVVLLCLLLPAFESVRTASGYWTFEGRPVPGPGTVLLAQLSSIAACALWDMELTRGHMTNGR